MDDCMYCQAAQYIVWPQRYWYCKNHRDHKGKLCFFFEYFYQSQEFQINFLQVFRQKHGIGVILFIYFINVWSN